MSSALLDAALTAALAICLAGLAWRAWRWLRTDVGPDAREAGPPARVAAMARTLASAVLGRGAPRTLGAFALDALLLRRLFRAAPLRAIGHHLALAGCAWLLVAHALGPIVVARFSPGYQPTLEPWLFLRDGFGAIALAGVLLLGFARRGAADASGRGRRAQRWTFVALLVAALVSGFLLEAQKIASPAAFERMVEQYAGDAAADRRAALRALWAREYGVAFGHAQPALDPASAAQGRALHEAACAACHAPPASAFVSWPLSRLLAPFARALDARGAGAGLLYVHALACLAVLATLPFTRFFHAVASPLALLLDAASPKRSSSGTASCAALGSARRALALDACVACALCDGTCAVAPISRWLGNDALLPMRKLAIIRERASERAPSLDVPRGRSHRDAERAAEGAFLCTDCGRCTRACPVGLDLADLWQAGRADFAAAGVWADRGGYAPNRPVRSEAPTPAPFEALTSAPSEPATAVPTGERRAAPWLPAGRSSLARCVQCQVCTNVCPVVAHGGGGPGELTPQRVMNLLRLGRSDLALGSQMVRACAACYQCQEHCPAGIPVADLLLELRAMAALRPGAACGGEVLA